VVSKREREYERRRYEKWQQRRAEHLARRRRQQVVAASVVGVLVVAIGVGAAVASSRGSSSDQASPSGSPSSTVDPAAGQPQPTATGTVPAASLAEGREWTGTLTLGTGELGITLDGAAAPQAVANFVTLARDGFFDSTKCHRLVTQGIHVLQCGSPDGTGTDGPGYSWGPIENAPADDVYPAGTIAMARVSNDGSSMGSQFFIVYEDSTIPSDSAGGYTVFGHVTSGLDVVRTIADAGTAQGSGDGSPVNDVIIEGVSIK
jgi:peptidyl-prolyl cis-trans isomerase B (cyclophilin B)